MSRTALLCAALAIGGYASAAWLTHDFQAWSAEGARRLDVALSPVAAPPVLVEGPATAAQPLPRVLADGQPVTIVHFVYTRSETVCLPPAGAPGSTPGTPMASRGCSRRPWCSRCS